MDKKKDVEGAIERAIASGKPALVEVTVHRDYPESGGVAYGWWDMPVPAYMEDRREKFVAARAEETV